MSDDDEVTLFSDPVSIELSRVHPADIDGMMRLRPYQLEAATSAFSEFIDGGSTLIVMVQARHVEVAYRVIGEFAERVLGFAPVLKATNRFGKRISM